MNTQNSIALKVGSYSGFALIVIGVGYRQLHLPVTSGWSWIFYALLPVIAWLAIHALQKHGAETGFKTQFIVSSYATVIASAFYVMSVFLYNALIDASLLAEVKNFLREGAVAAGKSGAALEQAYRLADVFTQPVPFAIAVFLQLAVTGVSMALMFALWNRWHDGRSETARNRNHGR